jgi:poly-gamma-glutamate synthesis protein (capsule biosynthesis protein)
MNGIDSECKDMYKDKYGDISISLVGDVMLSKRLPCSFPPRLEAVSNLMMQHECRIGNLETTVHYPEEGYPEAYPGGSYAMMSPHGLNDLKRLGFNMFSAANNHSMDYSHDGLLATLKYLRETDIPCAGIGKNLGEASHPVFFDCRDGRIALIGITSSFHDSYLAGPQNQDLQGRPGVNPLRHNAVYEVNETDFESLVRIGSETGINSYHDQAIKEGYLPQRATFKFGNFQFAKGTSGVLHTIPDEADLKRTVDSVKDAKYFADFVIVNIHSHQFKQRDKKLPPDFIRIFSQKCIEAGADIIVCHGPHLLRGIEIYEKGIIFHGLGNFILQHDQMHVLGEEQYIKYETTRQNCRGEGEVYALQTKNNTRGLNVIPETWRSVIVSIRCSGEALKVRIYPVILDRYGICNISDDISIIQEINTMSEQYNTSLDIDMRDKSGYLEINKEE